MAIDRKKYIPKYIDEAIENIRTVETLIFEIKDGVSVEDDLATLLRALHTLKGSSRMLEFKRVESLSHNLESVFVALKEERIALTDKAMRLSLASLDALKAGLGVIQKTGEDDMDAQIFEKELAALAVNEEFQIPPSPLSGTEAPEASGPEEEVTAEEVPETPEVPEKSSETRGKRKSGKRKKSGSGEAEDMGDVPGQEVDSGKSLVKAGTQSLEKMGERSLNKRGERLPPAAGRREEAKAESIRIPLEKIDAIIKSIASLQSLEISAKTMAMETAVFTDLVRAFSRSFKETHETETALIAELRKLETRSGKVSLAMKNYAVDVGNHIRGAYDSVISLRMLPISTILDGYPRYVFELSAELGKKVQLSIEGNENEIDKNIIEILSDVFLHMVRNAVDHGIESPEERLASGKDETGRLLIRCSRESGNMKIVINDDGRGIDYEKIRRKLLDEGQVTESMAVSLSKEDLTNYIFQSGFSTSSGVSHISGRGVGMDAVRGSIERLKGSIVIDSVYGAGTSFTILVPLSIAALMGFPIICGGMKFIIPANFVDTILLVNRGDIITMVDRPGIRYENRIIKLYYLNQILKMRDSSPGREQESLFVVIIRAYDDIIALVIDAISSMRSVILKSLPSFMEAMPVFSGIVLSEDYEMVPALHMPTVIRMAKRIKTIDMKKRHIDYEKLRKSVLVVDDSLPTREIESEILRAEGYKVDTAAHGAEAMTAAKHNRYDLICTDLNMPVMDGFQLTENIRKNEELAPIPIIVISSRESEEDQKRAAMLGATRYIIKNSFNNHNLLTAVKELIGAANV
jgi:chemotaxis protein histidine kinase CheA/CheY-like chemotaxis protein